MKSLIPPSLTAAAVLVVLGCGAPAGSPRVEPVPTAKPATPAPGSYADVDGLAMYYETHGTGTDGGTPLVLLHGGLTTIDLSFEQLLPALARGRRVIAIEQQAHGRTADRERPLTYEQMADDTATLLRGLGVERADFLGWSDGGVVALQLSIRHAPLVRKLILVETGFSSDAIDPQTRAWLERVTPEDFAALQPVYAALAPEPARWPVLIEKWKQLQLGFEGVPPASLQAIAAPALVVAADRGVPVEHTAQLFRLLPHAQLAVVPAADHFLLGTHAALVIALVEPFLAAP